MKFKVAGGLFKVVSASLSVRERVSQVFFKRAGILRSEKRGMQR
jgi:hypothetical protein